MKKIVVAFMALAAAFATVVVMTSSAAAATARATVACSAGTWGSVYGWGDCRGMGARKWQLALSCTWGGYAASSVITGDGHVDVRCPWGSARYASIVFR